MKLFFKLCTSVLIMIAFITCCYAQEPIDYDKVKQEAEKACNADAKAKATAEEYISKACDLGLQENLGLQESCDVFKKIQNSDTGQINQAVSIGKTIGKIIVLVISIYVIKKLFRGIKFIAMGIKNLFYK